MRTNIDIDDELMAAAMKAGPFKTKKEAVEAGLQLLKRQAAYREILKYRGQLTWGWDDADADEPAGAVTAPAATRPPATAQAAEPAKSYRATGLTKTEKPRGRR
ncbi:MAG: type II toxin-antitoxin system VapB family antitoxin [Burkholderiales bacterium]|nr:MAG: type II toxin-antitoxin system VapB family antitoxin [Burkholderiales bacterium]